jgi:hypothetical protein
VTLGVEKSPVTFFTIIRYNTDGTILYDWARFIAAESEEVLKIIEDRNPQVHEAVVKLRELSADEQVRDMYERREKAPRLGVG